MSKSRYRALAAFAAATGVVAGGATTTAQADGFACSASAITATVLGQTADPVRAGAPDACPASSNALDVLGAPLGGGTASAQTGTAFDRAAATSSLSGFDAGDLAGLSNLLPQIPIPAGLDALAVPLPIAGQLLGLPGVLDVDATDAARALITERRLPALPLVGADLVQTGVNAVCQAGNLVFDALSTVQRLTALGQVLPTDRPIDTAVPLLGADTVDFSQLNLGLIDLPGGLSLADPVLGPMLETALQTVVGGLPEVSVPAAVGRVVVDPAHEVGDGDSMRQLGPRVRVEVLGRQVIDATLGDVLVSALGSVCGTTAAAAPDLSPSTEAALSCAASGVVLTDVVEKDGKVKLVGVAAGQYVGRTIDLVLTHTGKRVARAVVAPDGTFRARAPLPSNTIRWTNAARYQARIDEQKSLALKLHRRMRISRMKPADGKVTIAGRIYGRRADDEVTIFRRESCTKDVEVTTIKPDSDGRWRVTLPTPEGVDAATYRATTTVRKGNNPKLFRTFTLPGHVSL